MIFVDKQFSFHINHDEIFPAEIIFEKIKLLLRPIIYHILIRSSHINTYKD